MESFRQDIASTSSNDRRDSVNLQQLVELKRFGSDERQMIIREAGLTIEVKPEQGLAMKTELGIPWNKIRHLRRYDIK